MNAALCIASGPRRPLRNERIDRPFAGFTLVEMLVVISIIGILAGLIVPATMMAVRHAKVAAIGVELNQLEAACKAYKERFGEYPPDFTGDLSYSSSPTAAQLAAENLVLQHLATAFPRYQPGVSQSWASPYTGWRGFLADVSYGWGLGPDYFTQSNNITALSPSTALLFWLGGQPDWQRDSNNNGRLILPTSNNFDLKNPVRGFLGLSANPLNPFDNGASRIPPFMDFRVGQCAWLNFTGTPGGLAYWAHGTEGAKTGDPIVYFRAENGNYTMDGATATTSSNANVKWLRTDRCTTTACTAFYAWPAADSGLSASGTYSWINPTSFQIYSAGLGMRYGMYSSTPSPLMYPAGSNYMQDTFDDITNFSGGTLEGKMP